MCIVMFVCILSLKLKVLSDVRVKWPNRFLFSVLSMKAFTIALSYLEVEQTGRLLEHLSRYDLCF